MAEGRGRGLDPFGLSFLDAMTCGLGAVILVYMIINAAVGLRSDRMTSDLQAEVDRIDREILDAYKNQVEVRNAVTDDDHQLAAAQGRARRLLEELRRIEAELATGGASTLARREHVNRLMAELKSLEEANRRLAANRPSPEPPGTHQRSFTGDGDRQYLTGLKVGGRRILLLVDKSASMLDRTLVNVIRRRNLPEEARRKAGKWRQAVRTVDWLTTQLPDDALFQLYVFDTEARPVLADTRGKWLDAGEPEILDQALEALDREVPSEGTSLHQAFAAVAAMRPPPDNVILLTDGLPTQGAKPAAAGMVSGKKRVKLFKRALERLPRSVPVNIILYPMEGDPQSASLFWQVALRSGGSLLSPSEDWP